jgi:hypothetical protein
MSKNRHGKLQLVSTGAPADASRAGKVTHDSRGNAVWDWAIETSVLAGKSAAELLTSLDDSAGLSLESEPPSGGDWSGDPYNRA